MVDELVEGRSEGVVLGYGRAQGGVVPRWAPAASVGAAVAFGWLLVGVWLTVQGLVMALPARGRWAYVTLVGLNVVASAVVGSASVLVLRLVARVRAGSPAATVVVLCCCGVFGLGLVGFLTWWLPVLVYAPRVEPVVLWGVCVVLLAVGIYGVAATLAARSLRERGGVEGRGASAEGELRCRVFAEGFLLAVGMGIGAMGMLRLCTALLMPMLRDRRTALPWGAEMSLRVQTTYIQPHIGWWVLGLGVVWGAAMVARLAVREGEGRRVELGRLGWWIAAVYAGVVGVLSLPVVWAVVAGSM